MRHIYSLVIVLLSSITCGCGHPDTEVSAYTIEEVIRTTSAPIDALTREIVKDLVPVELLCPVSEDPSSWRPTPDVILSYQRARLIITNGAGYEDWVRTAPLPRSRVIDASGLIDDQFLVIQGESHSHGTTRSHSHEMVLATVWLDPLFAISQAEVINKALAKSFPKFKSEFQSNFNTLSQELLDLHQQMNDIDFSEFRIIAPLNPYGYLAQRYNWNSSEIGVNPEDWSIGVSSIMLTSGNFDSKPTVILWGVDLSPETASELKPEQIFVVHWKITPSTPGTTFVYFHSINIQNLKSTIQNIAD